MNVEAIKVKVLIRYINGIICKVCNYMYGLTIRAKLALVILAFSVLPTIIGGVVSYSISKHWSEKDGMNSASQLISVTSSNLNKVFDGLQSIVYMITVNQTLMATLDYIPGSDLDKLTLSKSLDESIMKDIISIYDFISNVIIYSENGDYTIVIGSMGESITEGYKSFSIYKNSRQQQGKIQWYGPHDYEGSSYGYKLKNVISTVKSINKFKDYKYQGAVEVQTSAEKISKTLQNAIGNQNSYMYLLDSNKEVLMSVKNPSDSKQIPAIDFNNLADVHSGNETVQISEKEKYYCAYTKLSNGWVIVNAVPYSLFRNSSRDILKNTIIIVIISIFLTVILIGVVSKSLTKPIRLLIESMKQFREGDFSISIKQQDGRNEIAELSRNFNIMVVKIKTLIEKLIDEENKKKEAELDILQAQIAPHFLYNTLNMIKCMAMLKSEIEIAEVTKALTSLLELSINNRRNLITIEDEVEIANQYILLQKYKLSRQFEVKMSISDDVYLYKTPKLILQPIIENCILHGFENRETGNLIDIRIYKQMNDIVMKVLDNGIGITQDKIDEVLNSTSSRGKFNRIGINNLNDRIKLNFGEGYGITIESITGDSTVVTVRLPAIKSEQ